MPKATLQHAMRHLAHQGLGVRFALARDDYVGIFYHLVNTVCGGFHGIALVFRHECKTVIVTICWLV